MEQVGAALATEGLWFLAIGVVLAGLVRGFSGFGTAMVYMPFAAQVLEPVWALITILVFDRFGPLPALPRALRDGQPRDVLRLSAGALVGAPLGVLVLTGFSPEPFRWAVSGITLGLLICLVAGLRYAGPVGKPLIYATGGIGGLFGGALGLPGPPVILLYMARPLPAAAIRANTLLFLFLADLKMFGVFGARGLLAVTPLMLGLVLAVPYIAAVSLGAAIFDPARERLYRRVGYAIIAGSAIGGLPLFD